VEVMAKTCPCCRKPNGTAASACIFCGRELQDRPGHPEPFTGYPPPFGQVPTAEPQAPPETALPEFVTEADAPAEPYPAPAVPEVAPPPEVPTPLPVPDAPAVWPVPAEERVLPAELKATVLAYLSHGRKIAAIKLVREQARLDLATAKAVVDSMELRMSQAFAPARTAPGPTFVQPPSTDETASRAVAAVLGGLILPQTVVETIYTLTMRGSRIQAIVVLHDNSNLGRKEAREAIGRLALIIGAPTARPASCYIATACYGDSNHPDVAVLRRFRDERLLPTVPGRAFVRVYYAVSPALARRLARHTRLASVIRRRVLEPLVKRLRTRKTAVEIGRSSGK
jgi:hypothetical protein